MQSVIVGECGFTPGVLERLVCFVRLHATVNTETEADGHASKSGARAPRVCDKEKFAQLMTCMYVCVSLIRS